VQELRTLPAGGPAALRRFGAAPALVVDGEPLTYDRLADLVAARAASFGDGRRLVALPMANDLASVVDLLAARAAGHAVLLGPPCRLGAIADPFDPDTVVSGPGRTIELRHAPAHDLHPDLALLLSTSGSTGSAKLVRLSAENLDSNAAAIAAALAVRATDVAITSLPLHYCYGLSVLTSHLAAGACVVLTDGSVTDPGFWDLVDRHAVTTLAGVPHTFELLATTGFEQRSHSSLRTLTVAGGRLAPDAVRHWHGLGRRRGFDLFVMYGATEATARMLIAPPDLGAAHPAAAGLPVPGGSVRIDDGELVYRGPNVMLGYATCPADLARGRDIEELRTGDLARIDPATGLVEILGRRSRFAKVFGLRIDLQAVEDELARQGLQAWAAEGPEALLLGTSGDTARAAAVAAAFTGLPPGAVRVRPMPDVPRTDAGKPDYAALAAGFAAPAAGTVADLYARVFGRPVSAGDTFVGLGGDSLSYVAAAAGLQRLRPDLPPDWPTRTVAELAAPAPADTRRGVRLETPLVLRALAILLVVGSHIGTFDIRGGAHVLMVLAGFSFARFGLDAADRTRRNVRSLGRLLLPATLWLGALVLLSDAYGPSLLFGVNLFGPDEGAPEWRYWFVEALVYCLVPVVALLSLRRVGAAERARPFAFAIGAVVVGLALRLAFAGTEEPFSMFTPVVVFWCFAVGWALARARTLPQTLLILALYAVGSWNYFDEGWRALLVTAGVLALAFAPTVRVPGAAVPMLTAVAGASLWIYLVHWQVFPLIGDLGGSAWTWLALAASVTAGIAADQLWRRVAPW
jgi:acyl-CoA synthetase (AMP-forming)/AMP-acid ligase II